MCVEMKDIQRKDFIKGVSAAIVEQIPVANFFLSAIDNVKGNVLQRKFEEWQEMVGNRLSTLEKEVFDNLGNNETFATTILKTTELASHSNKKKMELLANAVKYRAPYMLCKYLTELANSFHHFYNYTRVLSEDKKDSLMKLSLVNSILVMNFSFQGVYILKLFLHLLIL